MSRRRRAHHASEDEQRNPRAAAVFGADGAFAPEHTRAALATLDAPVLLVAGTFDIAAAPPVVAEYAALFPHATLATLPAGGHYPRLDNPAWFTTTIASFLE